MSSEHHFVLKYFLNALCIYFGNFAELKSHGKQWMDTGGKCLRKIRLFFAFYILFYRRREQHDRCIRVRNTVTNCRGIKFQSRNTSVNK